MDAKADQRAALTFAAGDGGAGQKAALSGPWTNGGLPDVLKSFDRELEQVQGGALTLDLSGVTGVDMTGAWLIKKLLVRGATAGATLSITGSNRRINELLDALPDTLPQPEVKTGPRKPLVERILAPIGKMTVKIWRDMVSGMHILGSAVRGAQLKSGRGSGLSPAAVVNQLDQMGVRAVPIILLMSFLIGAIIAQQGAFQLRYFGGEVFVVDLVGILQLREVGVLLTAIMIAGRSGSAITAEIGSMKMREEIDALMVMGLNPIGVLIFPRLAALAIALPLLTIIANFAALSGAAVVTWAYSGITFQTFIDRLHDAVDYSTVITGMVKAPFMALIIGIVAAVEGLKVGGSAESLGRHVTSSVVKSIFVVILLDGLFAIFYAQIGY